MGDNYIINVISLINDPMNQRERSKKFVMSDKTSWVIDDFSAYEFFTQK